MSLVYTTSPTCPASPARFTRTPDGDRDNTVQALRSRRGTVPRDLGPASACRRRHHQTVCASPPARAARRCWSLQAPHGLGSIEPSTRATRGLLRLSRIIPDRPSEASRLRDGPATVATWLILPVVICLSQRLSHACLRISIYSANLRMAH